MLLRHWMHREHYQAVTAAINLTAMHVVTHLITHPEAAWSVVYMADPAFWQPHFDGVNFARCPEADFEVDGRRFGAFIHDWRFEPAPAWVSGRTGRSRSPAAMRPRRTRRLRRRIAPGTARPRDGRSCSTLGAG